MRTKFTFPFLLKNLENVGWTFGSFLIQKASTRVYKPTDLQSTECRDWSPVDQVVHTLVVACSEALWQLFWIRNKTRLAFSPSLGLTKFWQYNNGAQKQIIFKVKSIVYHNCILQAVFKVGHNVASFSSSYDIGKLDFQWCQCIPSLWTRLVFQWNNFVTARFTYIKTLSSALKPNFGLKWEFHQISNIKLCHFNCLRLN